MYTYKGVSYTEEEIKKAAKQSGITVQEYLNRLKELDPKPEDKQEFSSEDLLDPTTFQADAAAGAGVVSQPTQAPDTELVSEDISLDLPSSQFNSIVKAFGGDPEAIEKAKMSRAQLDD